MDAVRDTQKEKVHVALRPICDYHMLVFSGTTAHSMPWQNAKTSLPIHYMSMLLPLLQDIPYGLF